MPADEEYDGVLADAAGQLTVSRRQTSLGGGIVTVQLSRPDRHNAITFAMWSAFARLLPVLAEDDTVDVIVLRGTPGGPFSAGADIAEFGTLRGEPDQAARYGAAVAAGEQAIMSCPKPTLALVQGWAVGGGTQLAVACDLRICDDGAHFGVTPAKLGIIYPLPSTAWLVEVVGRAWASWFLLTGELVTAETALRIGLVHEVVASDELESRSEALASVLTSRARVSLAGAKAMLDRVGAGQLREDASVEALYAASLRSPEYAEGVAAFLGKRQPDFSAARR